MDSPKNTHEFYFRSDHEKLAASTLRRREPFEVNKFLQYMLRQRIEKYREPDMDRPARTVGFSSILQLME